MTERATSVPAPRRIRRNAVVPVFRAVAVLEAMSWLILIVLTVVKYAADAPLGVQIMGPIHGVLFIAYVLLALVVRPRVGWGTRATLIVLVDSVIPGGGLIVARRADLFT